MNPRDTVLSEKGKKEEILRTVHLDAVKDEANLPDGKYLGKKVW